MQTKKSQDKTNPPTNQSTNQPRLKDPTPRKKTTNEPTPQPKAANAKLSGIFFES